MTYCTAADVKVYVGTVVSDADLGAMIVNADQTVLNYFTARGTSVDTDTAKQASILLVRSMVAERFYLTGENPTSFSHGDYSQSGAADQFGLAKELRTEAFRLVAEYIAYKRTSPDSQTEVRRSDAVIDDFKLDQAEMPDPFDDYVEVET
jgi:hypothetical protein